MHYLLHCDSRATTLTYTIFRLHTLPAPPHTYPANTHTYPTVPTHTYPANTHTYPWPVVDNTRLWFVITHVQSLYHQIVVVHTSGRLDTNVRPDNNLRLERVVKVFDKLVKRVTKLY